jgi:hypothetical protein
MHIKHLKCSHQIVFLDLNVLFVYQMCTIHSKNLKGNFILMIKSAKGVEINFKIICYTYLHIWFKHDFGPLNYKI